MAGFGAIQSMLRWDSQFELSLDTTSDTMHIPLFRRQICIHVNFCTGRYIENYSMSPR